jgi:predicted RNase H-like nuclease
MTPPRAVLTAKSYPDANAIATRLIGKKISQQAWALRHNILRVETATSGDAPVIEVHPEVSFREMSDEAVAYRRHRGMDSTNEGHGSRKLGSRHRLS